MVIKKFNQSELAQKNSCKYGLMSKACTPNLVGGAAPVSEKLLPSKTAKFPFLTMDYSPWSMVIKKFNQSELAQKIHASMD